MKILRLGIGSLGGIFGYQLVKSGFDCTLITNNQAITQAIVEYGIRFKEVDKKEHHIKVNKCFTTLNELNLSNHFDVILFLIKIPALQKAAISVKSFLKESGIVVTFQNGFINHLLVETFPNRVITGVVGWGASMLSPGSYELTSKGKIFMGIMQQERRSNNSIAKEGLLEIRDLLSHVSQTEISSNIKGVIWSKLAINCCINAIAGITGQSIGDMVKTRSGRDLFLATYREVIEVANELNISLVSIVTSPYKLYLQSDAKFLTYWLKNFYVKIMGRRYKNVKPSLLLDLERRRPTEIEYLNGFIVTQAKKIGVEVPYNTCLLTMVKTIEKNLIKHLGDKNNVPHPKNIDLILKKCS